MILAELFDSGPKIVPKKNTDTMFEVEEVVGGREILFIAMADHEDESIWRVDFAEHLDADVDEPFVSVKTGKGKEFEVFSFVVACAKEFVKIKSPRVIQLKANKSEGSRAKLYARLASKFGTGYTIAQEENDRHVSVVMTRK